MFKLGYVTFDTTTLLFPPPQNAVRIREAVFEFLKDTGYIKRI